MAEQSKTLLRVEGITKNFPGVQALDNVSLNIEQGEIHGLLGENGAGKSTLVKIITGALKQDQGKVILFRDNEELSVSNPMEARESGIAAAYQHLVIAPELSIAENFFLGRLPTSRLRLVDWPNLYKKSRKILEEYNLDLDPRKKIKDLSVARQVMITIIKVLLDNVALVIFDEPTALLTNEQREMLFSLIRNLKDNGISVLYISHYIEEALDLCDRITVLKDGKLVNTVSAREVDENMLISMMVGRKLGDMYNIEHNQQEEEVLRGTEPD